MKRNSMSLFVLFAAAMIVAAGFTGCGGSKKQNIRNDLENRIGSRAAEYGGWIYYHEPNDENRLYKVRTDGKDATKLGDAQSAFMFENDGWIYFLKTYDSAPTLYRMDGSGENVQAMTDSKTDVVSEPILIGDQIYYINLRGNFLCRMNKDGSGRTQVSNESCENLALKDDWIYFLNTASGNIMRFDLYSGIETKISKDRAIDYEMDGSDIYYINAGAGDTLFYMDAEGNGKKQLTNTSVDDFILFRDSIVYASDNSVYRIFRDGTGRTHMFSGNNVNKISELRYAGDWVLFTARDNSLKGVQYKMKLDGTELQALK